MTGSDKWGLPKPIDDHVLLGLKTLTHEAKGKTPLDCSESGCHRPLGNKGQTYVEWD